MRSSPLNFLLFLGMAASLPASASDVVLKDHRIVVGLPEGWRQLVDQRPGILLHAQTDSGQISFMLTRPPSPAHPLSVRDPGFQKGGKQLLIDNGFSKIVRDEIIKVAGSDGYLCEAVQPSQTGSMIQVAWIHEGHATFLVFFSQNKALGEIEGVRAIINSVRVLPQASEPGPKISDDEIRKSLIGTWLPDEKTAKTVSGELTFNQDLRFEAFTVVKRPNGSARDDAAGKWKIQSGEITYEYTESTLLTIPLGYKSTDKIISISEKEFVTETEDGIRQVRIRKEK